MNLNSHMKNYILAIVFLVAIHNTYAQEGEVITFPNQSTVITTGVPFMLIAPDARSAAMGDMGIGFCFAAYDDSVLFIFTEQCPKPIRNLCCLQGVFPKS